MTTYAFSADMDGVAQSGAPNIYFGVAFTNAPLNEGGIFDTTRCSLVLPYRALVHVHWQVYIESGAEQPPTSAVFGAKLIRNPFVSSDPNDAGIGGDWKPAGIGTYGSIPGTMSAHGSCTDIGEEGDIYAVFAYVTSSGTPVVNGHHCHTWFHGVIEPR